MKKHSLELNPADFRIVSDNCIELGRQLYLCKADRGNGITMLYVCREGYDTAAKVTAEKMTDSSVEHISALVCNDDYYLYRLRDAVECYLPFEN